MLGVEVVAKARAQCVIERGAARHHLLRAGVVLEGGDVVRLNSSAISVKRVGDSPGRPVCIPPKVWEKIMRKP